MTALPQIIRIDRSKPLNLGDILSEEELTVGCTIHSQDERSLALHEINTSLVCFEEGRKENEFNVLSGRDIQNRLQENRILLDAQAVQQAFLNPEHQVEEWRRCGPYGQTNTIFAYGTIFKHPIHGLFVVGWGWRDGIKGTWKQRIIAMFDGGGMVNSPAVTYMIQ